MLIRARQIYDAWTFLREAYAESVERYVVQRTGAGSAGAVCEAVWNDVYRALPSYAADRSSRSWLLELARAKLEGPLPRAKALTLGRAMFGTHGAMQWSVNRRDFPAIDRAIAGLPDEDREVLELRYVNGLSADEIATVLDAHPRRVEQELAAIVERLLGSRSRLRRR